MDGTIIKRVLTLVDELRRRGVPESAVQPVLDWLDEEMDGPNGTGQVDK